MQWSDMTDVPTSTGFPDDYSWLPAQLDALGAPHVLSVAVRTLYIDAVGSISALRWGTPEPPELLFIHGGGQNAHTWDLLINLLGVPAIAVDLPGHGHSAWREDKNYSPQENADTLSRFIDADVGHPISVVGMSLGGLTALALADQHADMVRDLTIVDVLPEVEVTTRHLSKRDLGAVALMRGQRDFETFDEMLATAAAVRGRSTTQLERGVRHNARRHADGRWSWRYDDLISTPIPPTAPLWGTIEHFPRPITLIKGGASKFVSRAGLERFTALRSSSAVHLIEGAGHSVQSDAPTEMARHLRDQRSQSK